jgi:hypothetical protein
MNLLKFLEKKSQEVSRKSLGSLQEVLIKSPSWFYTGSSRLLFMSLINSYTLLYGMPSNPKGKNFVSKMLFFDVVF